MFVLSGAGGPDAERHESAFIMDSYNFLTPIDAEHTRYFWFQMRNVFPNDAEISRLMAEGVRNAFEEDRAILNAVQESFAQTHTPNIDIAIDAAPLRFRRRMQQLIVGQESSNVREIPC